MEQLWLSEPTKLQAYLEQYAKVTSEQLETAHKTFAAQTADEIMNVQGDVGIINISGVLTPDGPDAIDRMFGFGGTGFVQIRKAAAILKADDSIKRVVLSIDSPGGTVSGTDETFQALLDLSQSKELVAENHGMIASAAYWLALAADKIVATSVTNETGSIGVIVVGMDATGFFEKWGVKFVKVVSENAPRKAADFSSDIGIEEIQRRINAIERLFTARVAENRKATLKEVLSDFGRGGLLIANDPGEDMPDAVSVGMIDAIISNIIESTEIEETNNKLSTVIDSGGNAMTLQEMLAQNPSCRVEYDSALSKKYQDGVSASETATKIRVDKALPIMKSDAYPSKIKELAAKVIGGESDVAALDSAVAVIDSMNEEKASEAAAAEAAALGDTPPNSADVRPSENGVLSSEQQLQAEANRVSGRTEKVA